MSSNRFTAPVQPSAVADVPSDLLESRYRRAIYEMLVSVILAGEKLLDSNTSEPRRITDEVRDMLDAIDERRGW